MLGSGGQPGQYSCKWGHNEDGKKVQLLIRPAYQTKEYPHLTIDFDQNTGALAWFHYSPKQHSKNRVGASEFVILFKALYPALRTVQADVLISFLTKL